MKYLFSFFLVGISFVSLFAQIQIGGNIDGELAGDKCGHSVSISDDGKVLAIAAPGNGYDENQKGRVKVYEYSAGKWSQLGADIDGEAANDASGYAISLSDDGTVLAIGAPQNDDNGQGAGHVRVYKYVSGTWSQLGADIDGEATIDQSGFSVSLSGDGTFLAIGAPLNSDNGEFAGQVRVYEYNSGTWSQLGEDIDGEAAGDWSGDDVALSDDGTVLAIGITDIRNVDSAGYVRVYKYDSGNWSQLGADIDGEVAGERSGDDVALSNGGTVLAIGAPGKVNSENPNGRVKVYQYISGTWSQLGSDIIGEAAGDISGYSISLSNDGTVLAIGAPGNDDAGVIAGQVRIYKYVSGTWSQISTDIDGEAASDQCGVSVSLSGDGTVVAIGASGNDENGNEAGSVRVFDLTNTSEIDDLDLFSLVSIFPNPTEGNVQVTFDKSLYGSSYFIYDLVGKKVLKGKLNEVNQEIYLENLNRGTYTFVLEGSFNYCLKLVKL